VGQKGVEGQDARQNAGCVRVLRRCIRSQPIDHIADERFDILGDIQACQELLPDIEQRRPKQSHAIQTRRDLVDVSNLNENQT
jgi:hypothetical protein